MARTQRRRRKHRGTQAGTVRRRSRTTRPTSRADARGQQRQRRADRLNRPPSWRGAVNRAALAAGVFLAVLVLILGQSLGSAVALAGFMFLVYIPLGFAIDSFLFRFRQSRKEREGEAD